jgi:radical SAM protein with 4Fe4S-binding SPASM domain
VKFKTIYIDILTKKELHPKTKALDEAFFMPLHEVETMFSELRNVTDHLSFSLFYDVNEHPQLKDVLQLAFDYGFRYDIMLLSNKFINNLPLYNNNHSISEIQLCMETLEASHSIDTLKKAKQLKEAILTLEEYGHKILIDLPSRDKKHYHHTTLAFMHDLGFDLQQENWVNGVQLSLNDSITIRCCDRLKEPTDDVLPKKILGRCHGAVTMLGVMSDGTVIPCNNIRGQRIKLGNLFETPMIDILTSESFVSISEGFYKNQLVHPVCQHCPYPRKIF